MRRALGVGAAIAVIVAALLLSLSGRWPYQRVIQRPLLAPAPVQTVADTLHSGEALGELFGRHGIGALDLSRVVALLGVDPRRTKAGWVVHFGHGAADTGVSRVVVRTKPEEETRLSRHQDAWVAERLPIRWDTRAVRLEGVVTSTLSLAVATAVAEANLAPDDRLQLGWNLADVFAWQVDFTRDLQPKDRFAVLFNLSVSERGERRVGEILASEMRVGGRRFSAFRFATADGRNQYFDDSGSSLRRAFLKAPVEFRRVASGFSRSRFHPILQVWRRHEGIDYAAASGTPVLAAGDGSVVLAGWSGGYGRTIELRHRNGVSTRYAHLRGFSPGIRTGAWVRQGEVIGFVGSTGLATSAHLHYEFRVGGVARNPAGVDLGQGDPLPKSLQQAFDLERRRLVALLKPLAGVFPPLADQVE